MADSSQSSKVCIASLIVGPAVITLAVTLLRLLGELQHWPKLFFSSAPGGGWAIVGISWLPIIFGPYFAVKIARSTGQPVRFGKTLGFAALGAVVFVLSGFLAFAPGSSPGRMVLGLLLMAASAALQFVPWRALANALIAYAYAARIPVAIVMFFAMRGSWGTHYDALPPEAPIPSNFWLKFLYLALIPQLVMWIAYTIILGALVGAVYAAIVLRKQRATPPESQHVAGA